MPQPSRQRVFQGKAFRQEAIKLDGKHFVDCIFVDCIIQYAGTGPVRIDGDTHFTDCRWQLVGPAGAAIDFIRELAKLPGLEHLVDQMTRHITGGEIDDDAYQRPSWSRPPAADA